MTVYGYARVSTDGQTLAAQEGELTVAGAAKVYAEKVSGAKTDRAELGKLLKRLQPPYRRAMHVEAPGDIGLCLASL